MNKKTIVEAYAGGRVFANVIEQKTSSIFQATVYEHTSVYDASKFPETGNYTGPLKIDNPRTVLYQAAKLFFDRDIKETWQPNVMGESLRQWQSPGLQGWTVVHPKLRSLADCVVSWQRATEETEPAAPMLTPPPGRKGPAVCGCDMRDLMMHGCKCGALAAERSARR